MNLDEDVILRYIKIKLANKDIVFDDIIKQKINETSIKIFDELMGYKCITDKKIFKQIIHIIYYYLIGKYNQYTKKAKRRMNEHQKNIMKQIDFISSNLNDNSPELKSIKEYLLLLKLKINVYPSIYLKNFQEPTHIYTKQHLKKELLQLLNTKARLKSIDNKKLKVSDYVYTQKKCKNIIDEIIKFVDNILKQEKDDILKREK